ncbi:MAG TPA: DUF503 domain-containing protein [Clostridia bacterium]|nr:DUF503 domain-containing protein [Clostridia bacterium]
MFIASAQVEIFLYDSQSLKEKRQVVKSLIAKISNQFNVSIAEVDLMDIWQRASIGLACVSNASVHAQKQLESILEHMEEDIRFEITQILRQLY